MSIMMSNERHHATRANVGSLALAFLLAFPGFSDGRDDSKESPPPPGKAIGKGTGAGTDAAVALLKKAAECKDRMLKT
jgi:hypothetical protein